MSLPKLYLNELKKSGPNRKVLTCIRQAAGSNLFWLIDNNDWLFCGFPQSLQANSGTTP